ncbi:MAG: 1-acyl-sn-glycerol-3-phosphate acyltransferase [Legionellaceae bacterium]|nr:1-acyl-sn-glycerol-3-phosphate acyltransferase [Legionellaceae bacterium]HAF87451.1 1-acyl-sn-glycerol-3-phosphate acyltransferase [Legionellales bacterium]|tara:strand:- start:570 stop:1298 length:729 start_codon:yes stop_codon:yes gene_type:complete
MKASRISTFWILFLTMLSTANICAKAIFMRLLNRISRHWVDNIIQRWSQQVLRLAQIKCVVVNPYHVVPHKGQATIVMCNHASLYDIPLSFSVFPNHSMRMLAKKELFRIPIMGKGMKAAEFPFIDRKRRQQSLNDLQHMRDLMESGIVVWIAPEGTRSVDGSLATFKKGAFITAIEAKAHIIPIGIQGAHDVLPARTYQLKLNQRVEIHVGQAIDASLYTLADKEQLIADVRQSMQQLLKV